MKIYLAKFNAVLCARKPSKAFLSEEEAEEYCERRNQGMLDEENAMLEELGEEPMDYDEYCGDFFDDAWEVEEIEVEE